jgi:hypothetical protein
LLDVLELRAESFLPLKRRIEVGMGCYVAPLTYMI